MADALSKLKRSIGDPVRVVCGGRYSGSRGVVAEKRPSFGGIYRLRITHAVEWQGEPETIRPGDLLLVFPDELRRDTAARRD